MECLPVDGDSTLGRTGPRAQAHGKRGLNWRKEQHGTEVLADAQMAWLSTDYPVYQDCCRQWE